MPSQETDFSPEGPVTRWEFLNASFAKAIRTALPNMQDPRRGPPLPPELNSHQMDALWAVEQRNKVARSYAAGAKFSFLGRNHHPNRVIH